MTARAERPHAGTLILLRDLTAEGVIERRWHPHHPTECDGMMVCVCPDIRYSYVVTDTYRDELERQS